ncbi:hypothetical protein WA158_001094 [Blastocystis sp. Blastoise]
MKFITLFLALLITCFACEPDEVSLTVMKHYTSYSSEESFELFRGDATTGTSLLSVTGVSADQNTDKYWTVCTTLTLHTVVMKDKYGDGWGSATTNPYVSFQIKGLEMFRTTMPNQSGTSYTTDVKTFTPRLDLIFGVAWKYTDVSQSGTGWTEHNYSDSAWSFFNGGSFPVYTTTTRYYRSTFIMLNTSEFTIPLLSLFTTQGVAVYIQGIEVYRHKLPAGTLTSTTTATSTADEITNAMKLFSFNKHLLPNIDTFTIAIEVHQYTGHITDPDYFDLGGLFQGPTTVNSCSASQFTDGVAASDIAPGISNSGASVLFDGSSASYYYTLTSSAVTFTYTFNNGKAFWVNSYAIFAANTILYGHPKSWKLFASLDGNTWDLLDIQDNIVFSTVLEKKQISLRSNEKSYKMFKLQVLDSSMSGKLAIGRFEIYTCNYAALSPGLHYEPSTITAYAIIDSISSGPAVNGYNQYTITPALPTGLSLNAINGFITGVSPVPVSQTFTITATNFNTLQPSTTTLTLNIIKCGYPDSQQIRFRKVNKNYASEESWTMTNTSGTTIFSSPTLTNSVDQTFVLCVAVGIYTVHVRDSFGDGWSTGSRLYLELLDSTNNYYPIGSYFESDTVNKDFPVNINFIIPIESSGWTYIQGTVPAQWYSQFATPAGFNAFPITTPPTASSHIWLFRHTFTVSNLNSYAGAELRVKARAGYQIFINDYMIFSKNINGEITSTSSASGGDSVSSFKSITFATSTLQEGSNIIAIGIVNLQGNNPTTLLFDASLQLNTESIFGRTWDLTLTNEPSGQNLDKLMDLDIDTYWSVSPSPLAPASITFTFGEGRAEFINKYCVTSSSQVYAYDPSDWAVYGSNDVGVTWTLLGNVTNAYFSDRKVERCFFLPENFDSWNKYKFLFTEPAVPSASPYSFTIAELSATSVNMKAIQVPALSFSSTTFSGYVGVPFPEVTPSSPLWGNFRIRPALTLPLELDTSTGSIRGTPNTPMASTAFAILASNPQGMESSVIINLSVSLCQAPKILFTVLIHSGAAGNEQGFTLYNKNGVQLMTKTGFTNNQDSYFPFCEDADAYSLKVTDSGKNGWDAGYFKILLQDNTEVIRGSLGTSESEKTFPIAVGYVIPPVTTEWKYLNSGSAATSGWNTASFADNTWKQALSSAFEAAIGTTQYFRKTFDIDSLETYASASFNIKTRYGVIVYVNGEEQYRYNMPEGTVSYNTYALSEKSEVLNVGSAMSISFGNIINGHNVIAIELHRSEKPTTTTIDFDGSLLVAIEGSYRVIDGIASSDVESDNTDGAINGVSKAFDNILGSVYVSTTGRCVGGTLAWTYNNNRREYISSYTVVTGPKCNTRHPSDWEFQGSNDEVNWSTLNVITNKKFSTYKESYTVNFFNNKVYNSYRMKVNGCNNEAISTASSSEGVGCDIGAAGQGLQLAELGLYAKRITGACNPDGTNGWGGALEGDYAYKNCPSYYEGRIQALCTNGVRGPEDPKCNLMKPQRIRYSTKMMNVYKGDSFSYDCQVSAANFVCSTSPSLPDGVSIEANTGRIYGKVRTVMNSVSYTVTCENSAGSISTEIFIAAIEKPGLPVYAWVIIAILAFIIIAIVVLCIINRTKSRKNKGHTNLDKKGAKGKTNGKKQTDTTNNKVVKV